MKNVYIFLVVFNASFFPVYAQLFGGQIKSKNALFYQYPPGSSFCVSTPTAIVDLTSPTTGKIWMDRNLGAIRAATSSNDESAFGDLYQWGRGSDGHQCRNSTTTNIQSLFDQPGHGKFIINQDDWRNTPNQNLWQGVDGINNPCPKGYRLPTEMEFQNENSNWMRSNFRLTKAGRRNRNDGEISNIREDGYYWTSGWIIDRGISYDFDDELLGESNDRTKPSGLSIRCIKN